MNQVQGNETVKLHYTGKLNDGQVFDSSIEREPLEVKLGEGRLIPGFEKGLVDMKVNDKKRLLFHKTRHTAKFKKSFSKKYQMKIFFRK